MAEKNPAPPIWIDGFSAFEQGINSGVAPLLLQKNQLSFAINSTVRGNYITHRPFLRKMALTFDTQASQDIFQAQGLWQGGCFFKSEYGTEAMVVSIGGHLFQVRPDSGINAAVTDVSIPGDLDSSGLALAWLWQSERWVIDQNGEQLPLFFDGQTTRRSFGPQIQLQQVAVGNDFVAPAIGASIDITLDANYTGPVNATILIDQAYYQVNSAATGYSITLRNLTETAGSNVAAGTSLIIPSNLIGLTLTSVIAGPSTIQPGRLRDALLSFGFDLRSFFPIPTFPSCGGGNVVLRSPDQGTTYVSTNALIEQVRSGCPVSNSDIPNGFLEVFGYGGYSGNSVPIPANTAAYLGAFNAASTIGKTVQSFVNPAVGNTVDVFVNMPYNGNLGVKVTINGAVYEIVATNNSAAIANVINVTNINDTAGTPHGPASPDPGILYTIPEMQIGKMGAYGLGRNWYSLADARSYRATDIVGSSSGSPSVQNRDAVLRETQNTFLTGGNFVIPGNIGDIRSLTFPATLDSSLGQGPLQVGTPNTIFSCNAPVDAAIWQTMDNPIQTQSLKGAGPLSQYGTILINSDMFFRSTLGWSSLVLARREFSSWGNTPISREVQRVVDQDNTALLQFNSAIEFNNRFISTSKPIQSQAGVFHQGSVALNFEPISGINQKAPPVWDGLWIGINALLWITGSFSDVKRAFAFTYNFITNKIELYELLADNHDGTIADNDGEIDVPVTWQFETGMLFKEIKGKGQYDLCKIIDGELYVSEVAGTVGFEIFYRSQFDPCWHDWTHFSICADQDAPLARQQNRVLLGLGRPPADACDPANNRPYFVGETFQFKIRITGHCKFYGMIVKASPEPKSYFAKAMCGDQECKLVQCLPDDDYGAYILQDRVIPEAQTFFNNTVFYIHTACPGSETLTLTGSVPGWITLDAANHRLVGAQGQYAADTQEQADINAQNAINDFALAAIASGDLACVSAAPTIILVNAETTGWGAEAALAFDELAGTWYGLGTANFYSSTDGINFTNLGAHGLASPADLATGAGLFVVADNGFNRMYSSPNGTAWTTHAVAAPSEAVAFGAGIFVAVYQNSLTSPDGLVWTDQGIFFTHMRCIAFGAGLFVAVGQNGEIWSSPNGIAWTNRVTIGGNFWSVRFANSQFVVGGNGGDIYTSPDGITWTAHPGAIASLAQVRAVGGNNSEFVATTFDGDLYTSTDGATWTFLRSEPSARIPSGTGSDYFSAVNILDIGFFP